MNMAARTVWVLVLVILVFAIGSVIDFYWVEHAASKLTFSTIFEVIEPLYLFVWVPDIILYSLVGWLLFFKRSIYLWFFCGSVLFFEFYMITQGFSEHSTLSIKIWAYMSYLVPTASIILGNSFAKQLTSQETTPPARTRFQRARS